MVSETEKIVGYAKKNGKSQSETEHNRRNPYCLVSGWPSHLLKLFKAVDYIPCECVMFHNFGLVRFSYTPKKRGAVRSVPKEYLHFKLNLLKYIDKKAQ